MIDVKDSLLLTGKVWSLDFLGIYIYIPKNLIVRPIGTGFHPSNPYSTSMAQVDT